MDRQPVYADRSWTAADGLVLHARDYAPEGPALGLPVVCLHGLTRNARDFEDLAPRLAAMGRRVVVPDVRGRGASAYDPKPSRYTPKTYARDLAAMLDAMGIDRAIFIGTSMGALITMALAAVRPAAIAGAILNDAGPEVAPEGIERIKSYAGQTSPVRTWRDAAAYARAINGSALPSLSAGDWDRVARRLFRDGPDGPVLDYDPNIAVPLAKAAPWYAGWIAQWLFKRLARRAPLMLIRGQHSDIITPAIAARMKRRAPAMEVVDIPGVGHAPMLDEPESIDAITRFLRRVD